MTFSLIHYELQDGIVTIQLNCPERANALSRPMMVEIRTALDFALGDRAARVVVLRGSGRAFCSGADLKGDGDTPITEKDLGEGLELFVNPMIRRIRDLPKPVVAAVNGAAVGAGCNLALACDIVIAARSARFIEPFARLGLVIDAGGSYALSRLIGSARTKGLALLADEVSASTAHSWGMIWDVVDDTLLDDAVLRVATRLASLPASALGAIKQMLHASEANSFQQQLDVERDLQRVACKSEDFREAVSAFQEKRQPKFK
jgi:2-(1,2-epoxy-1,2-dihydrophenyl)acetyl-CoA isomerase